MTAPWLAIVNPRAAGGRCARGARDALFALREAGERVVAVETRGPGHATELARDAARDGQRRFLSVGGDGTHFEVANGLFEAGRPVRDDACLGMIPLGTGNSFVRDLDVASVADALGAITRGARRRVDVVRATHTSGDLVYLNLLSIGFTAHAGALTNRHFKPLGALGYVLAVLLATSRLTHPRFPLAITAPNADDADGSSASAESARDDRACTFISFSNSRYTGGAMMMAPTADVADGALDVVRMGPIGKGELAMSFPRIFRGTHTAMAAHEHARARAVRLFLDGPTDVMVDGEVLSLQLEGLEVLPGALEVVA